MKIPVTFFWPQFLWLLLIVPLLLLVYLWLLRRKKKTAVRYASRDDSLRIMQGLPVAPEAVYFRCQPRLEAASPAWAWLAESQFIGTGRRAPDGVFLSFYRVC